MLQSSTLLPSSLDLRAPSQIEIFSRRTHRDGRATPWPGEAAAGVGEAVCADGGRRPLGGYRAGRRRNPVKRPLGLGGRGKGEGRREEELKEGAPA